MEVNELFAVLVTELARELRILASVLKKMDVLVAEDNLLVSTVTVAGDICRGVTELADSNAPDMVLEVPR